MELMTAKEAAQELKLSYMQTRIYLGDPYDFEICANGRKRLLYTRERVEEIKKRHAEMLAEKEKTKGTRKCYQCGSRVAPNDLTSGICSRCQAFKLVKNFVCHGDYIHSVIDHNRIACVQEAVDRLITQATQTPQ